MKGVHAIIDQDVHVRQGWVGNRLGEQRAYIATVTSATIHRYALCAVIGREGGGGGEGGRRFVYRSEGTLHTPVRTLNIPTAAHKRRHMLIFREACARTHASTDTSMRTHSPVRAGIKAVIGRGPALITELL